MTNWKKILALVFVSSFFIVPVVVGFMNDPIFTIKVLILTAWGFGAFVSFIYLVSEGKYD